MMVIEGTSTGVTGNIHPADRCTWTITDIPDTELSRGNGYSISNVQYYPGDVAAIDVTAARFGYLGKSGRFVAISE